MTSRLFARVLHVVTLLTLVTIGATSLHLFSERIDYGLEAQYSQNLRKLEALDAELNAQVLATRSNLAYRYDSLAEQTRALVNLQHALVQVPQFLGRDAVAQLGRALSQHAELTQRKDAAIEEFKSANAVLRNSLHYFPTAAHYSVGTRSRRTSEAAPAIRQALGALLALEVMPTPETQSAFERAAQALDDAKSGERDVTRAAQLELLAEHARIILERSLKVDRLIRDIVSPVTTRSAAQLASQYSAFYRKKLDVVRSQQSTLLALGIALVACALLEVIRRQYLQTSALARASHELEGANAALSKERERERELNRLKSQFVSMTSHEFRTPLAGIISSTELLEKYAMRWDPEKIQTHLSRIKTVALHMNRMLEEMLLIGRADARMLQPTPAQFNLDRYCQQLIATVGSNFPAHKGVQYKFSGNETVHLDERLLTHVMSNLIENAFKYTNDVGCIDVVVKSEGARCEIVVKDDGIGIPPSELDDIFEGFHRASNVGRIPGTGLGLAAARRSLEVLGGKISVQSQMGHGTAFTVKLPIHANGSSAGEDTLP